MPFRILWIFETFPHVKMLPAVTFFKTSKTTVSSSNYVEGPPWDSCYSNRILLFILRRAVKAFRARHRCSISCKNLHARFGGSFRGERGCWAYVQRRLHLPYPRPRSFLMTTERFFCSITYFGQTQDGRCLAVSCKTTNLRTTPCAARYPRRSDLRQLT